MPISVLYMNSLRRVWLVIVLLMLAMASVSSLQAESQSIATRTEVPSGEWQAIKMRGLPAGASLEVQLETDGRLQVFIVDEEQFQRLAREAGALFASAFNSRLQFKLKIPESANYFLVLDNRQGEASRQVSVGITGAR